MSILGNIIDAIRNLLGGTMSQQDMAAALDKKETAVPEHLDWRRSIVDLMKLVGMDSSLEARKQLAKELGYTGKLNGSAEMNMWLHSKVMERIRKEGIT